MCQNFDIHVVCPSHVRFIFVDREISWYSLNGMQPTVLLWVKQSLPCRLLQIIFIYQCIVKKKMYRKLVYLPHFYFYFYLEIVVIYY